LRSVRPRRSSDTAELLSTQVFAATTDLQGAVFNPLYSIDVRLPRPGS